MAVKKLSFDALFKTNSMFYNNDEYENEISELIENKVDKLASELPVISTREGLRKYIVADEEALADIIQVMGISAEKFMRMVSMIRKDMGYVFESEWKLKDIRNNMIQNATIMNKVCELLYNGKNNPQYKGKIPTFTLDRLIIDEQTMNRLSNRTALEDCVRRGLDGKYSNNTSALMQQQIIGELECACRQFGLEYKKDIKVPLLKRSTNFVMEDETNPSLIIDVSYSVTTASSMSSKMKVARDTRQIIDKVNKHRDKKIMFINFIDGAGWIARQADMREIFRNSDYVLNFNNLKDLTNIIGDNISIF